MMVTFCAAVLAASVAGQHEAGLLPAGPSASLFYWLTPARSGNATAPLLVWLNGGPGASSMMGLFMELGPYTVSPDGLSLGPPREYSWNADHHVLFVDQPAGTGFSVATAASGYANTQAEVGETFLRFMQAFYSKYPSMRRCDLFLTGESYAGKYLPSIANAILQGSDGAVRSYLKGVVIGNGLTVPREMTISVPISYHSVGLLDRAQQETASDLAAACVALIDAKNWSGATHARSVLFDFIGTASGPMSAPNVDNFQVYGEYNNSALTKFLNLPETKAMLNLPLCASWSEHSDTVHR